MSLVGILLAAGSSSRFGAPKLLHKMADGVPIGIVAARVMQEALPKVIAVLRPADRQLRDAFTDIGLEVIENSRAASGMGTSVATGVRAAVNASGCIIALADMPWVKAATVTSLADRLHQGDSIVAPVHCGRRGNPVGFAAHWFPKLRGLSGDRGARDLLSQYSDQLRLVNTADAGVLADVNRPEDL
jgi:molybdenum cofactor cytidylyltransferase